MSALSISLLQLIACAALVLLAGIRLARYGDILATKTGLGGTWIGLVLMATVTSLPELITGASAVLVFDVPEIAVGDALGSCMFNLVILACLDFGRRVPLSATLHQGHVLSAGFGLVQLGGAALAMLAGPLAPTVGWVGLHSLVFLAVYGAATRTVSNFERSRISALAEEMTGEIRYRNVSRERTIVLFVLAAGVLVGAATYLPGAGAAVAQHTGLDQSFVGSLFVAVATSLPEVVVSVAAARIGALDMAASNLFGSNLFNVAVLGIDDILYRSGSLLATVSGAHTITATSAMIMTAVAVIGLTYRAQHKRYRLAWDALAMITVYLIATMLLWRQG